MKMLIEKIQQILYKTLFFKPLMVDVRKVIQTHKKSFEKAEHAEAAIENATGLDAKLKEVDAAADYIKQWRDECRVDSLNFLNVLGFN